MYKKEVERLFEKPNNVNKMIFYAKKIALDLHI